MKQIFSVFMVVLCTLGLQAQIETPQPSPEQTLKQRVGLTDVTIEYARPSMRGRAIFGSLVPYDKLWRTGANNNSVITFSQDVKINGKNVKSGKYAIYSKPGLSNWEVYFYTDTNNWGLPAEWQEEKIAAQINVPTEHLAVDTETFTFSIDRVTNDEATLGISWGKTYVGIPIDFKTDEFVSANIQRAMNGPNASDYYAAAVYYFEAGKDIQQAKKWMDTAINQMKNPTYWQLRQKSLIYMKSGDKNGAIEAAKASLNLAKEAKNDDYVALNNKSLKEWGAL